MNVYLRTGATGFTRMTGFSFNKPIVAFALGDFTRDGRVDLAAGWVDQSTSPRTTGVHVAAGNGDGTFRSLGDAPLPGWPTRDGGCGFQPRWTGRPRDVTCRAVRAPRAVRRRRGRLVRIGVARSHGARRRRRGRCQRGWTARHRHHGLREPRGRVHGAAGGGLCRARQPRGRRRVWMGHRRLQCLHDRRRRFRCRRAPGCIDDRRRSPPRTGRRYVRARIVRSGRSRLQHARTIRRLQRRRLAGHRHGIAQSHQRRAQPAEREQPSADGPGRRSRRLDTRTRGKRTATSPQADPIRICTS